MTVTASFGWSFVTRSSHAYLFILEDDKKKKTVGKKLQIDSEKNRRVTLAFDFEDNFNEFVC